MSAAMMLFRSFVRPALAVALLTGLAGCASSSLTAPPAQKAGAPADLAPDAALTATNAGDASPDEGGQGTAAAAAPVGDESMAQDNEELDDGAESPAQL